MNEACGKQQFWYDGWSLFSVSAVILFCARCALFSFLCGDVFVRFVWQLLNLAQEHKSTKVYHLFMYCGLSCGMQEEKLCIGCLDVSFLVGCAGLSGMLFLEFVPDVLSVCFLKGRSELSSGIGRSLSGNASRMVVVGLLPLLPTVEVFWMPLPSWKGRSNKECDVTGRCT